MSTRLEKMCPKCLSEIYDESVDRGPHLGAGKGGDATILRKCSICNHKWIVHVFVCLREAQVGGG